MTDQQLGQGETKGSPKAEPVRESSRCEGCGLSFKSPQGLAGHRRLAHSTSAARALEERSRGLGEHQRALEARAAEIEQREASARQQVESTRRRETALARREQAIREAEETTSADKVRREISQFKDGLPEYEEGEIVRFGGNDYRVEDGRLSHVYFPDGEKHEHEEGDLLRIGERVYWVHSDGGIGGLFAELKAFPLTDGEIAETILEQEYEEGDGEEISESEDDEAPVEEE